MMKNKFMPMLVVMLVMLAFATPLVAASEETGTGQSRLVTLSTPEADANVTVTVPAKWNNETANSLVFTVEENGGADDYLINVSINNNGSYTNKSISVTSVDGQNVTAYANYTAGELGEFYDGNCSIELVFDTNYTAVDDWYGEIDLLSADEYTISVTTTQLMVAVLSMGIALLFVVKVLGSLSETAKEEK